MIFCHSVIVILLFSGPFPISLGPLIQNESSYENEFDLHEMNL